MQCNDARPLVPAYMDGELSETRASLLRKHLLECQACRTAMQEGRALARWFGALREASSDPRSEFAVAVPSGFASRVARRAFSGDTGEHGETQLAPARREGGRLLRFVLQATSIAAAVLFVLAIALGRQTRPTGSHLSADDATLAPLETLVDELERLDGSQPQDPKADPPPATRRTLSKPRQ